MLLPPITRIFYEAQYILHRLFPYAEERLHEYLNDITENLPPDDDDDDDDDSSEMSFGVRLSDKYFMCFGGDVMIDLRCLLKYPQMRRLTNSVEEIRFVNQLVEELILLSLSLSCPCLQRCFNAVR